MSFHDLVPILQGAIGPVILISGVGLLLLSMTNRFGKLLDRSRAMVDVLRGSPAHERDRLRTELEILYHRARILRTSIALAIVSVLMAALLIISLFLAALFHLEAGVAIAAFFIICLTSLIASLIYFLMDINQSLAAFKLTLETTRKGNE